MTVRKTITVQAIRNTANAQLARNFWTQDAKRAICMMLESVLHETGNYRGYNNTLWLDGGCGAWQEAGKPEGWIKAAFIGPEYDRQYY